MITTTTTTAIVTYCYNYYCQGGKDFTTFDLREKGVGLGYGC